MKNAVLIIGAGPYGLHLAKRFSNEGFFVIMSTIEEGQIATIQSLNCFPVYTKNLHEDGCQEIHDRTIEVLNNYSLELKYIVHTARFAFYEFTDANPPEDRMIEMYKINSESPLLLAKLFVDMNCQFVYTSSGASLGYNKNLLIPAIPEKNGKKIGTRGLKYYSYTKRKGEEKLYDFFKTNRKLDSLVIIYISLMFDTNFFKDINVTTPKGNGWSAERVANYLVQELFKNKKRIYAGPQAQLMKRLPSSLIAILLDRAEKLQLINRN